METKKDGIVKKKREHSKRYNHYLEQLKELQKMVLSIRQNRNMVIHTPEDQNKDYSYLSMDL